MDTIDVQSKSFVVKWIQIPDKSTVVFQLKPIKKSVGFSIYKSTTSHVNNNGGSTDTLSSPAGNELKEGENHRKSIYMSNNSSTSSLQRKRSSSNLSQNLSLEERLQKSSLVKVQSYGTLQGNEVFQNELTVEEGGIFAFIFDNTFSKSNSKKVLFNKFIVDEQSSAPIEGRPRNSSTTSLSNGKFDPASSKFLQGYLLKKKRKRLQGFTKRFFILNFKYNTLTYYMNENSLKTRGEMQINISSVTAFQNEHTIVIDSGMDVWFLKTLNKNDWTNWINAFDYIKMNNFPVKVASAQSPSIPGSPQKSKEQPSFRVPLSSTPSSSSVGVTLRRRKVSQIIEEEDPLSSQNELSYISGKLESIHLKLTNSIDPDTNFELNELREYIKSLLLESPKIGPSSETRDDSMGAELSRTTSSLSLDTFYDAEESLDFEETKKAYHVHVLEGGTAESPFPVEVEELSDDEETDGTTQLHPSATCADETDLSPLPILQPVKRRNDIAKSTSQPPSLFSFLRKNVGKDLSTISMPVTSNEPLTILQKLAEMFEYSSLLNEAMQESDPEMKLLKISTFAISNLAALRSKERNSRKPFNPILGETFEFVDDVQNFKFIGEKINHKPQVFAVHADSNDWECSFNLLPDQKFWGKSIELNNKGCVALVCKKTGEMFRWTQPTTILKNIIAGERYSEPSDSIVVTSSIGLKSIVEFKKPASSLFSSNRSEELTVKLVNMESNKKPTQLYATGTWTKEMTLKSTDDASLAQPLWKATELPKDESTKWGFTRFATNLNEITDNERDKLPHTDSRFRPDIQRYERGDIEKAELLKLDIEQIQRDRRKEIADAGQVHQPMFFQKKSQTKYENLEDELLNYEFIKGQRSYWNRRKTGDWGEGGFKLW